MRYNKTKTDDNVYNFITDLIEFNKHSHNLIEAKSFKEFEVWFEKCEEIDKRSLLLFLRNNKDKIPKDYLDKVRGRFTLI